MNKSSSYLVVEQDRMQSNANWLVGKKMHTSSGQVLRMSIHSGAQETLGKVEKFSALYLVRITKVVVILQQGS